MADENIDDKLEDIFRRAMLALELANRVIHTKTHSPDCRFSGCTCGAAGDFANAYGEYSRAKEEFVREFKPNKNTQMAESADASGSKSDV